MWLGGDSVGQHGVGGRCGGGCTGALGSCVGQGMVPPALTAAGGGGLGCAGLGTGTRWPWWEGAARTGVGVPVCASRTVLEGGDFAFSHFPPQNGAPAPSENVSSNTKAPYSLYASMYRSM